MVDQKTKCAQYAEAMLQILASHKLARFHSYTQVTSSGGFIPITNGQNGLTREIMPGC
jgi:hypothetical protein